MVVKFTAVKHELQRAGRIPHLFVALLLRTVLIGGERCCPSCTVDSAILKPRENLKSVIMRSSNIQYVFIGVELEVYLLWIIKTRFL